MQRSVSYNFLFAGAVCVVCAVFVSASAVGLKERQEENATLDRQRNVLVAAGLAGDDERLTRAQIEERFAPIQAVVIDTVSGAELPDVDPLTFDQRRRSDQPRDESTRIFQPGPRRSRSGPGARLQEADRERRDRARDPPGGGQGPLVHALRVPRARRRSRDDSRPHLLRAQGDAGARRRGRTIRSGRRSGRAGAPSTRISSPGSKSSRGWLARRTRTRIGSTDSPVRPSRAEASQTCCVSGSGSRASAPTWSDGGRRGPPEWPASQ